MATSFEDRVNELKQETSFDEDVCGCFLSNYMKPRICEAANGWCKELSKCNILAQIGK